MTTATQTAPITAPADRFRCEADVPDPPPDAAGRKQYWEDTVAEAVAELRRRLASTRDEKSFQALQMILDLEKTRIRHKAPVAGTQTGGGRWADGLEPLPVYDAESDREFALKKAEPKTEDLTPPAAPIRAESVSDGSSQPLTPPARTEPETPLPSYPFPPKPLRPIPLRERVKLQNGIIGHFHDHDDYLLERGRGRRKPDKREEQPAEIDLEAVRAALPPPPPLPRVRSFDLFSLRDEAPAVSGRAVSP